MGAIADFLFGRLSRAFATRAPVVDQPFLIELGKCIAEQQGDFIGYRPGAKYGLTTFATIGTVAVTGGAGGAANSPMYAHPIFIKREVTIASLSVIVGTAVSNTNVKLALYDHNLQTLGPSNLIAACSGTGNMASTANTEVVLSFPSPVKLTPGIYWVASMFNGASQPFTIQAGSVGAGFLGNLLGANDASGLYRNSAAAQVTRVQGENQDFNVGFPPTFGSVTYGSGTPGAPAIAFTVAS